MKIKIEFVDINFLSKINFIIGDKYTLFHKRDIYSSIDVIFEGKSRIDVYPIFSTISYTGLQYPLVDYTYNSKELKEVTVIKEIEEHIWVDNSFKKNKELLFNLNKEFIILKRRRIGMSYRVAKIPLVWIAIKRTNSIRLILRNIK